MIGFWWKKVKSCHKYCPDEIGTAFIPKFMPNAKLRNSFFLESCHIQKFFAAVLP